MPCEGFLIFLQGRHHVNLLPLHPIPLLHISHQPVFYDRRAFSDAKMNKKHRIRLGADAVYMGGPELSLRTACEGFSGEELGLAVADAHTAGERVY